MHAKTQRSYRFPTFLECSTLQVRAGAVYNRKLMKLALFYGENFRLEPDSIHQDNEHTNAKRTVLIRN